MSRNVNTSFVLKQHAASGGRRGEIHFGSWGVIQTPALFPAICIMTGPPGFGRQGSHYKYIKRIMCRDWRHDHFLTEILHFSDYMATRKSLEEWLQKPFQQWMDEMMIGGDLKSRDQGRADDFDYDRTERFYDACFFLDSGGYKLLSNSDFSIEKFGYPTNPESILQLQTIMGGDIIASLDYPLAPVAYEPKTLLDLQNKSLQNALWLLRTVGARRKAEPKPLIYLAVHGVDYESSKNYTERLLSAIDHEGARYGAFGFAIGSLVPRRGNRALVASIVKGVTDGIREHRSGVYIDKPVHAFGMSGDMIPTLALLGVDTFDTNAFVQSGKNLRYVLPHGKMGKSPRTTWNLDQISNETFKACGCRACSHYSNKAEAARILDALKWLTRQQRDQQHRYPGIDRDLIKSEVYAILALHNLEMEYRELDAVRQRIERNTLPAYVQQYAHRTNTRGALIKAYEAATGELCPAPEGRRVSLDLTRDSFSLPDTYRPPEGKEILLLLPCTKDKPYRTARSHQAVFSALHKDARIHVVTISGLYGPVPEELEEVSEVMLYDYVLSPEARDQSAEVTRRLTRFLDQHGGSYRIIVAYVTTRAYREVAKKAFRAYRRGVLLPKSPREQTSKEFLRYENIRELQATLRKHLHTNGAVIQMNLTY
jgi:queuine/archaeosine tRNA-ribosyltransferase